MADAIIWVPLDRLFFGIAISINFFGAYIFYNRGRQRESGSDRKLLFGFALSMLGSGLGWTFYYLADFYYNGAFIGFAYVGVIVCPYFNGAK